jgi:hypothetical protein
MSRVTDAPGANLRERAAEHVRETVEGNEECSQLTS